MNKNIKLINLVLVFISILFLYLFVEKYNEFRTNKVETNIFQKNKNYEFFFDKNISNKYFDIVTPKQFSFEKLINGNENLFNLNYTNQFLRKEKVSISNSIKNVNILSNFLNKFKPICDNLCYNTKLEKFELPQYSIIIFEKNNNYIYDNEEVFLNFEILNINKNIDQDFTFYETENYFIHFNKKRSNKRNILIPTETINNSVLKNIYFIKEKKINDLKFDYFDGELKPYFFKNDFDNQFNNINNFLFYNHRYEKFDIDKEKEFFATNQYFNKLNINLIDINETKFSYFYFFNKKISYQILSSYDLFPVYNYIEQINLLKLFIISLLFLYLLIFFIYFKINHLFISTYIFINSLYFIIFNLDIFTLQYLIWLNIFVCALFSLNFIYLFFKSIFSFSVIFLCFFLISFGLDLYILKVLSRDFSAFTLSTIILLLRNFKNVQTL